MSENELLKRLPDLIRRLVDDFLAATKQNDALEAENTELKETLLFYAGCSDAEFTADSGTKAGRCLRSYGYL